MSRRRANATGRTEKAPRHVRLYQTMMKSVAWRCLDAVARSLYLEISMRYGGPGSNNGRIPYSVREGAAALKIGKTKAARGLVQLEHHGFIVAVTAGAFSRKDRHASEWRLTEFGCDVTGVLATRDYERWSPEIQNSVPERGLTVPQHGPFGTQRRTVAA